MRQYPLTRQYFMMGIKDFKTSILAGRSVHARAYGPVIKGVTRIHIDGKVYPRNHDFSISYPQIFEVV